MLKKKEKNICPICENGNKVIKTFSLKDVENLLEEIKDFQYQEEGFKCDFDDIEIGILADGTTIIEAEFKGTLSKIIR